MAVPWPRIRDKQGPTCYCVCSPSTGVQAAAVTQRQTEKQRRAPTSWTGAAAPEAEARAGSSPGLAVQPWANPSASLGLVSFSEKGTRNPCCVGSLVCGGGAGVCVAFLPGSPSSLFSPTLAPIGLMLGEGSRKQPQAVWILSPRSLIFGLAY